MKWIRHGRAAIALLAACLRARRRRCGTAHAADLTVVDDGWITDPSVTPSAFAPGAARAPNGDIVVTYNTDGDGISGARVWLQRSTDDGATWSAPVLVKAPSQYPSGGSVNAQLSLTTLSDGTMLLPITESRTNTRYTDRESVTWVLRSTDSGRTWTGGTTPISFPVPMYFNASYGRVVEAGGALLMPVWGAPTAPSTPGGLINPTPWQAGVLRSTDGGRTWSSYHLIGADPVAPPYTADLPANVTETVITPLPDGRLLAVLRSDSNLGNGTRWFYQSWSSDGGLTWSRLVQSHIAGDGHDLFPVACGPGATKLLLAHEDPVSHQVIARTSYDGGVRWIDPLVLIRPAGSGTAGHDIYPAFVTLPGSRLLVVYSHVPIDTHKRIAYNVLQDVSSATCADHAAAALATAGTQPGVYVERADAADWPLPYGRRELFPSASSTVASLATAATPEVTCAPGSVTLYRERQSAVADGDAGGGRHRQRRPRERPRDAQHRRRSRSASPIRTPTRTDASSTASTPTARRAWRSTGGRAASACGSRSAAGSS